MIFLARLPISAREVLQSPSQFVRYFTGLLSIALVPSASRQYSALFHLLSLAGWFAIIHGIVQYCFASSLKAWPALSCDLLRFVDLVAC